MEILGVRSKYLRESTPKTRRIKTYHRCKVNNETEIEKANVFIFKEKRASS